MERTSNNFRAVTEMPQTCSKCGALLPANARSCSACVLQTGLDLLTEAAGESAEGAAAEVALSEFGEYELLEELGRGGQGVVYRARQPSLNRTVALKIVGLGQWASSPQLKRFRQEAEAAASLEHPGIVPIYEIGECERSCYFSMKFVEGGSLDAVLGSEPMAPMKAAKLMVKVARIVQFAHTRGVLHRDIKPGNILLDANGEPHLTDFGLARLLEHERTITNSRDVLGTPSYIAPEQASEAAKELTPAVDIYALGAVFYHMLTGEPPFAGATPYETVRMVLQAEPRNPRLCNRNIDLDLATVCLKALEKDPNQRYSSAEALADDLERWLRTEPIRARRTGAMSRSRKWLRRNQSTALALGSLAALLVVGTLFVWKTWFIHIQPVNGIAVLPFESLSEDKANAYLADGIQDEILTRLSNIRQLKVISRTSTQSYKSRPPNLREIGRQLGVAHLLEGSVQKSGDAVHINVQLIDAANDSHLWANTFDRQLSDIFSVEAEVAKAVADQLRAKLTGNEERSISARPTDNPEAYNAYLRGLAYNLRQIYSPANVLSAQKYLKEAVRLDPKFALAWALLSYVDARGYLTRNLQPTLALREEARCAAETALTLQPALAEAVVANGYYHFACLRDYDVAVRYFERARPLLPNDSRVAESLAYVARRRGQWEAAEAEFNEAERLDPRNVYLLMQHAQTYILRRRFADALQKLERVFDIVPDDPDVIGLMAAIAQADGDLARGSALLGPIALAADDPSLLEIQLYQTIIERRPTTLIPALQAILDKADPKLGYYNGELRVWLGWAQQLSGDDAGARNNWEEARLELELLISEQPDNNSVIEDAALANMFLHRKAEALAFAEQAMARVPIGTDALTGPRELEILARVAAQTGESDRAIAALEKLLSIPYSGAIVGAVPITPAFLRLDPMFDPLRNEPRFRKLIGD